MFKTCQIGNVSDSFFTYFQTENIVRNITNFDQIEQFELSK